MSHSLFSRHPTCLTMHWCVVPIQVKEMGLVCASNQQFFKAPLSELSMLISACFSWSRVFEAFDALPVLKHPFQYLVSPWFEKTLPLGFLKIHEFQKMGLWKRLLCILPGRNWKLVLNSSHALKKPCMHGKWKLIMDFKALGPHVRIWTLVVFLSFSFSLIMSA